MLKFLTKVAAQHALSAIPGAALYRHLQDWTGSRSAHISTVHAKVGTGIFYLDALDSLDASDVLREGAVVDIGGGWHLTIPLLYWQLGAERQHVSDIRRHAREDAVFGTAALLPTAAVSRPRRALPDPSGRTLDEYLRSLGIRYHVPCTSPIPVLPGSASLVMATQMLLHPPRDMVRTIFEDAARLLKSGGYFVGTIHLYDIYSNWDPRLPRFNFLHYSESTWNRWFNCRHMTYNRLRVSDYKKLFEGLPFDCATWNVAWPTESEIVELDRLPPHPEYAAYDRRDLAASDLFFVMRRQ